MTVFIIALFLHSQPGVPLYAQNAAGDAVAFRDLKSCVMALEEVVKPDVAKRFGKDVSLVVCKEVKVDPQTGEILK